MAKIGVGIIGVQPDRSWAAIAHIPALRALPDDFEIVALSTTRQESADAAAAHFGVPNAFDSAEALATCPSVDLVSITVKVPQHLELVRTAIGAGKHVYCEWPLGNGLAEARTLAAMAAERGVKAVCGMQARFSPTFLHAKDLINRGFVGDILSVSVVGSGGNWGAFVDQPNAYTFNIANGATMLSIAVGHMLDGLGQLVGEVETVHALLANSRSSAILVDTGQAIPMTAHDQVLLHGMLAGGAPISAHYRGGTPRGTGLLIEINGTGGDLQICGVSGHSQLEELTLSGATGDHQVSAPIAVPREYASPVNNALVGNVARAYRQFANDLRDGTSLCPSFEDAVVRHRTIAAIEASARSGIIIRPSDF